MINTENFDIFLEKCFQELFPYKKFYKSWHIKVIVDYIEAILNSKFNRSIINMPPRSMKSFCFSVVLPAWILGHKPSINIIVASYSYGLSIKHSLDTRYIMSTDWYKDIFPNTVISNDQNTKIKFKTKQHGFRLASSTGGYLTGEGADIIIADDPITPMQINSENIRNKNIEWFENSLLTRLNNFNKGKVIVIMHRLHKDDLTGYLLNKQKSPWHNLCIPFLSNKQKTYNSFNNKDIIIKLKKNNTINPEIYSYKDTKKIKNEIGSYVFKTQYQQEISKNESCMVKYEWFQRFTEYPKMPYKTIYSCDTASSEKGNYSVFMQINIKDQLFYITDIIRLKCDYIKLKQIAKKVCKNIKPDYIIIENKSTGIALIQELSNMTNTKIIKINPYHSKLTRFESCLSIIESGKVVLPKESKWLKEFEKEILLFPNSKNDDQVDVLSQFINWYKVHNNNYIRKL